MDGPVPSRAGPASSVNLIMQSLCFQLVSEVDFKAMTHVCFEAEDLGSDLLQPAFSTGLALGEKVLRGPRGPGMPKAVGVRTWRH